jgi:hypothetical protein
MIRARSLPALVLLAALGACASGPAPRAPNTPPLAESVRDYRFAFKREIYEDSAKLCRAFGGKHEFEDAFGAMNARQVDWDSRTDKDVQVTYRWTCVSSDHDSFGSAMASTVGGLVSAFSLGVLPTASESGKLELRVSMSIGSKKLFSNHYEGNATTVGSLFYTDQTTRLSEALGTSVAKDLIARFFAELEQDGALDQ